MSGLGLKVANLRCMNKKLHLGHFYTVSFASTPVKYWCPGDILEKDK